MDFDVPVENVAPISYDTQATTTVDPVYIHGYRLMFENVALWDVAIDDQNGYYTNEGDFIPVASHVYNLPDDMRHAFCNFIHSLDGLDGTLNLGFNPPDGDGVDELIAYIGLAGVALGATGGLAGVIGSGVIGSAGGLAFLEGMVGATAALEIYYGSIAFGSLLTTIGTSAAGFAAFMQMVGSGNPPAGVCDHQEGHV